MEFLKIVKESIKIVSKNRKFMASITTFTLVPPSLLLVLVFHIHKLLTKKVDKAMLEYLWSDSDTGYTPNQIIAYNLALLLLSTIPYVLTTFLVSYISAIAVILVSASSYTGNISSFTDLLSQIKATCARKLIPSYFHSRRRPRSRIAQYTAVAAALPTCLLVTYYPNAVTFGIGIVVVIALALLGLRASVVTTVAAVIAVVEESREAEERAREFVRGHGRLDGFMINLVVGLPLWIEFTAYSWMLLEDKWYSNFNFALHGLIFVNSISLARIFVGVAYTVLYFHRRGQEIHRSLLPKE